MPCLSEEQILGFLARDLPAEDLSAIEEHIDGCPTCRTLLGFAAKDRHSSRAGDDPAPPPPGTRVIEGGEPRAGVLTPGDLVDHFRIERAIGRGGMGEIFLATDTTLKRKVALKLLSTHLYDSDEAKERLLVEARATARLNHPHVVAIYSVGEHAGQPYLALEYLEGETLLERRNRDDPVRLEEALRIGLAIAEALAEAHHHEILHRDLKPGNVFLANDGRLRVLDFGLAKLVRAPAVGPGTSIDALTTGEGVVMGTPSHMAPEQWRGEEVTVTTDTWALGLILYELLAGRRPYPERSTISYALRVCEPDPVPTVGSIDGVPQTVADLVAGCLRKDPSQRLTAPEVVAVIRDLLADDTAWVGSRLAEAAAEWERGGRADPQLWDGVLLARAQQAIELGTVPLPAEAAGFLTASTRRVHAEERRKQRRLRLASIAVGVLAVMAVVLAGLALTSERAARQERQRVELERAAALVEGARAAQQSDQQLVARAKLRSGLEVSDSVLGRFLWWELGHDPLVASRDLGTGLFDVAVSPDGTTIAAAAQDRTVYLIDSQTLALRSLRGHRDQVLRVAFSPDGQRLASSSWSSEVRVWEPEAGTVRVLSNPGAPITALVFGADSQRLYGAQKRGPILSWDLAGGSPPTAWGPETGGSELRLSADGSRLVVLETGGGVSIWDTSKQSRVGTLELPAGEAEVRGLALDASGEILATTSATGGVRLWSLPAGESLRRLDSTESTLARIRFDSGGAFLVGAGRRSLTVWELATGRSFSLPGHPGAVTGLAAFNGRPLIVSAGLDRAVRLWRLDVGPAMAPGGHRDGVAAVAFSGDGRLVVSGGYDRSLTVWDVASGRAIREVSGHEDTIYAVAQAPVTGLWASASWDRTVRLWNLATGTTRVVLEGHEGGVYALAFSPAGEALATASTDGTVRTWLAETGEQTALLRGHTGPVFDVAWSADGERLASAGADKTIRVWEARSGRELGLKTGHEASVWSIAFSPDGQSLASGSYDQTVRLWPLAGGEGRIVGRHDGRVYAVAFHPTRPLLIAAGADGAVKSWRLDTGEGRVLGHHGAEVNAVRVSADGRLAVTGSDDATVRVWEIEDRRPLWRAPLLQTSPARLATAQGWRDPTGRSPLASPGAHWERNLTAVARSADLSADGNHLCIAAFDGHVEGWDLSADARRFNAPSPGGEPASTVVSIGSGCAVLAGDVARLYLPSGAYRELRRHVSAIAAGGTPPLLWVATDHQLLTFDAQGEEQAGASAIDPGATALARMGTQTLVGYANGKIETLGEVDGPRPGPALRATPSSPVTLIRAGPHRTLIAGFANGFIGIWSRESGSLLLARHLHGAVRFAAFEQGAVLAATELGDTFGPIDVFGASHCDLLRKIWQEIPVVWRDGRVVTKASPVDHSCRGAAE